MGIRNRDGALYAATGIDNTGLYEGRREAMGIIKAMAGQITSFDVFSGIGISAATAFAQAAKSSYDFEKEFHKNMLEVATISTQVEGSMTDFMNQVMSITQVIPIKAPDAAKALYQIVSAGHDGADGMNVLEVAAKSAIGGITDTVTAADAITTLLNAYKLSADDAEKVSDQLFTTARLGKTTFGEMGQSIAQVAPIAAAYGVEMDQVLAAIATLTKSGTPTAQAMTQIRASIIGTSKVLGDGAFDSMTFQEALAEIANRAGGSEAKLRELIPEVEAVNGVLGLTGIKAQDAADHLKEMNNSAGATEAAFKLMMNDVDKQMTLLSNNIQAALRPMGQAILKEVSEVATAFNEAFDNGDAKEAMKTLGDLIVIVTGAFIGYKGAVIASTTVQNIHTKAIVVSRLASIQHITTTKLMTNAIKAQTVALLKNVAALATNPYVLAAAAVAALGYGLYKYATQATVAEKAIAAHNKRVKDLSEWADKTKEKGDEMLSSLKDENVLMTDKVNIYKDLQNLYKGEVKNISLQNFLLMDSVEANNLLAKALDERTKAQQRANVNAIEAEIKTNDFRISELDKKEGMNTSIGEWFELRRLKSRNEQLKIEFEKAKNIVIQGLKDEAAAKKVAETLDNDNESGKTVLERKVKLTKELAEAQTNLNKLRAPNSTAKNSEIDKAASDVETIKGKLKALTGVTEKAAASLHKTKQEHADLLLEISRNAKERENAERQTAFEIEQVKIDVMKDGFVKEQAQIDLNHRKALQGITLRGEEMLKAQQEAERKQWEKDGKKGVFTPKTTSVSQLPTEQLQQLSGLMNGVVAGTDNQNQMLIDGMVKQYQTYAEKRKEIEKKFDDDIRSMQDKNTDGKYDANIVEAKKQKTEAIAELDSTVIANKSMWTRLFSDTSAMSKKQIKQILSEIKNLTDYLEGISVTVPVGFTQEQLEQLKKDPEKIKAIYDELIKKQDELDDRTNYPFSGIIKGFGKLKEAAELAQKATKATTEEERKILEYQAESAKAKGMDYIREGAVMASDSVSMLADKLKELAAATGDERFSESAEQFGALAQNLGAAAKGFQSGGWIGAIIGGATDMLTQTFQAITTAKAEVVEFENNRKDFLAEYNLLLLKNRISSEDQDNVFGTSALKRASEAAKAAQDAMTQYTEEVTKRTAPEIKKEFKNLGAAIFGMNPFTSANFLGFGKSISNETKTLQAAFEKGYSDLQAMAVKTKDRSGWANFWGKKDEYTSLKDLAPQLWDKETGDFDIEAAKVFLDTNTQISEEQRKQVQNVIDLKETYNDAMQVLKDDVADTFGSLGTGLMDSIVGAIQNGDIAMDKFADSVGKTFENLGKKIAQELFFQREFDKLQEDLVKTYDMGDSEAIANAQMDIVSRFFDSIGGKMDKAEAWMEEWKKKAAEKGFTLWGEGESDWLGTTTDSIAQSILDGLEAGKSGIADFTDDFESLMKKAVLNSIKMKYLEEPLKEFYKKFASFSESGGQLTEAEIEELRGMYGDIVSGAKAQFDNLKDIAGLDFTSDSDNSLKGAYAKASEESITLLAGQTGATRVVMEDIKNQMQPIREQMQFIYDLQKEGWQDVKAIRDLTTKIDKNTEQVAENTAKIKDIADNTKRTMDALEGTIDVKVKMT